MAWWARTEVKRSSKNVMGTSGTALRQRRTAYHDLVDLLLAHVLPEKVEELVGGHRGQPIGNDAQGVGDGQPRALATIVDGQDATHPLFT